MTETHMLAPACTSGIVGHNSDEMRNIFLFYIPEWKLSLNVMHFSVSAVI